MRRAADGGGGRRLPPRAAEQRQDQEVRPASACAWSSSRPRTCSAAWRAKRRDGQTLVGFAAEHGEGAIEYGRDKLEQKCLDAVVVNDISRTDIGFDAEANEVTILTAGGEQPRPARIQGSRREVHPRRGGR